MAAKPKAETNSGLVVIKGAREITIDGKAYLPGDTLDLSAEALNSQGIKHLFVVKDIEFVDDSKRTREYVEGIKRKDQTPLKQDVEAARENPED